MSARRNPEKGWGLTLQVQPWQVLGWTAMLCGWRPCPSSKSLLPMLVFLGQMWDIAEPFKSSQADEAVEGKEALMYLTRCCKGLAVNMCAHAIFFCKLLRDLR